MRAMIVVVLSSILSPLRCCSERVRHFCTYPGTSTRTDDELSSITCMCSDTLAEGLELPAEMY
jgi:hypothetical protein